MTYAVEMTANTSKMVQLMRNVKMRILKTIHGKTLQDRIRNEELRECSNIQDVARWTREWKKYWGKHVSRMKNNRLAKKARNKLPGGDHRADYLSAGENVGHPLLWRCIIVI